MNRIDMDRIDMARIDMNRSVDFAADFAGFKAGQKKPKPGAADYARRFALERAAQRRRFCDAFALWRTCPRKSCRRQYCCGGDQNACLKRALGRVPQPAQWRAREAILAATPHNIGAPERKARLLMPRDCYE